MKRKTTLQRISNLLNDLIVRNSEEIANSLNIKHKTVQQALWRDQSKPEKERVVHRFTDKGKPYYYGRGRRDIFEHRIERLEKENKRLTYLNREWEKWVKACLNRNEQLKKEIQKLKDKKV